MSPATRRCPDRCANALSNYGGRQRRSVRASCAISLTSAPSRLVTPPSCALGPAGPVRAPLAKDVVAQDGEVVLARDADPWADPVLTLRAARAAAEHNLPLAPFTLERLATESAPMRQPWPRAALDDFVAVL